MSRLCIVTEQSNFHSESTLKLQRNHMLEKQYYYLDDAAKFLSSTTGLSISVDDLIDQAIQAKLFMHISASNWLVKYKNKEPFQFDGYCGLESLSLKSALQAIKRGEKFFVASVPVTRTELLRYCIPDDEEEFAILIQATKTSCPLTITDFVIKHDCLLEFVELHCSPQQPISIVEQECATQTLPTETSFANQFRRNKTGTWDFKFNNKTYPSMSDRKGFCYIQQLLKNQNNAIKAIELNSLFFEPNKILDQEDTGALLDQGLSVVESSNAGQCIDSVAIRQYKKRIEELKELIEEALACEDIDTVEHLREEYDFLIQEIKINTNSRGNTKTDKNDSRKISQAVSRNIKNAIADITSQYPELAEHLTTSIKTGMTCKYEPALSINWVFY